MCTEIAEKYKEIEKASYADACKLLQQKYGIPRGNYFTDETCTQKNTKIRRVPEGLFIHHIDEYNPKFPFATGISSPEKAIDFPFEFQEANRLCYCNYIEHCLLHMKIYTRRRREMDTAGRLHTLDDGLTRYLFPEIAELYFGSGKVKDREPSYLEAIKDDREYFIYLYSNFTKAFPQIAGCVKVTITNN